jgi:hypothetical protein
VFPDAWHDTPLELPPLLEPPLLLALALHWLEQFCATHVPIAWPADVQLASCAFDAQFAALAEL